MVIDDGALHESTHGDVSTIDANGRTFPVCTEREYIVPVCFVLGFAAATLLRRGGLAARTLGRGSRTLAPTPPPTNQAIGRANTTEKPVTVDAHNDSNGIDPRGPSVGSASLIGVEEAVSAILITALFTNLTLVESADSSPLSSSDHVC